MTYVQPLLHENRVLPLYQSEKEKNSSKGMRHIEHCICGLKALVKTY